MDMYCQGLADLVTALAAAGPLREALLVAVQVRLLTWQGPLLTWQGPLLPAADEQRLAGGVQLTL
jgi:hypothetical protein